MGVRSAQPRSRRARLDAAAEGAADGPNRRLRTQGAFSGDIWQELRATAIRADSSGSKMPTTEKKARERTADSFLRRDLAELRERIDQVARLLDQREVSWAFKAPGEAWNNMLTLFAHKTLQNARSVLELSHYGDAGLIARSMLESIALLRYANEDRESRPLLWSEFDAVQAVRESRERLEFEERPGREEDIAETRELLSIALAERARVGHKFIDQKRVKEAKKKGEIDADVYVNQWHEPISRLIAKHQSPATLFLYRRFSEAHHGRARHFSKARRPRSDRPDFNRVEWRAQAVNVALVCLNAIVFLFDSPPPSRHPPSGHAAPAKGASRHG